MSGYRFYKLFNLFGEKVKPLEVNAVNVKINMVGK